MDEEVMRVLLVDDDELQHLILGKFLSKSKSHFKLDWVNSSKKAFEAIAHNSYDVYLVDYYIDEMYGTDVIRRAIKEGVKEPMILLTSSEELEVDLEAMDAGAVEYMVKKDINAVLLERAIRYAIDRKRIETQLEETAQELQESLEAQNMLNDSLISSWIEVRAAKAALEKANEHLEQANEQMQSDLDLAREFQQTILPDIEYPPFLQIVEKYYPYEGGVSGDIYDMSLNSEGALNIFLGDASGHGVAAALMTMLLQMALDNIPNDLPTHETMQRLNTLLASRETGKYMTGVYLRVTPEGEVRMSHAGHPPVIILSKNEPEPILFHSHACPLGMFRNEPKPYVEKIYQLSPGDKILLYTDGLTEWMHKNGEMYGVERITKYLKDNQEYEMEEIVDGLLADVEQFSDGNNGDDDLTILGFKFQKLEP